MTQRYPRDGFDTDWELNTDGPLQVPVWMWDNRITGSGKVFDASGRGNHGVLVNEPAWEVTENGPVLDFNGADNHILLNDGGKFTDMLVGDAFSIFAWVYSRESAYNDIIGAPRTDGGMGWEFFLYDNLRLGVYRENVFTLSSTDIRTLNVWQHVGVSCDGTTCCFCVDGQPVDSIAWTIPIKPTTHGVTIGIDTRDQLGYELNAMLTGLTVFDQGLSASQFHALYQSQFPGGPGCLGRSTTPLWVPSGGTTGGPFPHYTRRLHTGGMVPC